MEDVASQKDTRGIPIDWVGIEGLKMPINVKDKDTTRGYQQTIGTFDVYVSLDAEDRGTHMSRIVECIYKGANDISQSELHKMCIQLIEKLEVVDCKIKIKFSYFTDEISPTSKLPNKITHECWFEATMHVDKPLDTSVLTFDFQMGCTVDIFSVCPCALAICEGRAAHAQRGTIDIGVKPVEDKWVWLEDIIQIARQSGSAPVYDRLKRIDEQSVCYSAFAHPKFTEDILRDVVKELINNTDIAGYKVIVTNQESIHSHQAVAQHQCNWEE